MDRTCGDRGRDLQKNDQQTYPYTGSAHEMFHSWFLEKLPYGFCCPICCPEIFVPLKRELIARCEGKISANRKWAQRESMACGVLHPLDYWIRKMCSISLRNTLKASGHKMPLLLGWQKCFRPISFPGVLGPRLTFGGYTLAGSLEKGIDKRGVLLGYEQPITKKFSVVTDWSSGNN